jgi:septal ring factor EnvC (AmiA/AmiB activator)
MFSSVDPRPGKRLAFYATVTASLLAAGCTLPVQTTAQTVSSEPPAQVAPTPVAAPVPARRAVAELLEHADRVRNLQGAELAHEIARLNDAGAPADQLRLAMALSQTRQLYDLVRAQELLQRVLSNPAEEAQELHVLARLLSARYAEQRRLEDQVDRQNQQLRDLQRRLAENQEKLDALKEIERSLTSRPPAARVAPASSPTPNGRTRAPGS